MIGTKTDTQFELVGDSELKMTVTLNAPRELVFKAWIEPAHLMAWWGPRPWPTVKCTVDLRPGGSWHYCMKSVETGEETWGKGIYHEIVPPEKLVYSDYFSDAEGNLNSPEMLITVLLEDLGERTRMTGLTRFQSKEHRDQIIGMGMQEGMTDSLERLVEHLAAASAA